jgi:hypothetical protein
MYKCLLQAMQPLLEPGRQEGEALEGRNGVLWEVLPMFEYILDCFYESVLVRYQDDDQFLDSKLTIITRKQMNLLPISYGNTLSRL